MKADKNEVKSLVSMKDIMGLYGMQSHRGKYVCPFHSDQSPSLSIKEPIYTCFSCQSTGDIFSFVMHMNNCAFPVALDYICAQFNIPNDNESTLEQIRNLKEAQRMRKIDAQRRKNAEMVGRYAYDRLIAYRRFLWALDKDDVERCHMLAYIDFLLDDYLDNKVRCGEDFPDINGWIKKQRQRMCCDEVNKR